MDNSYATKVAAKSRDKKASEIGLLINASSITDWMTNHSRATQPGARPQIRE
jgi:uncharacterized membrane protein